MEPPPEADDPSCTFGRCFCRWLRFCSSRIPHVAPGRDYERVPPCADDDRAAWSLLVAFTSPFPGKGPLRLRRFRVAVSGRVLGRSDDALEVVGDVDYKPRGLVSIISAAGFPTPSPGGRSLSICFFCQDCLLPDDHQKIEPPRPLLLHLEQLNAAADRRITLSPLPDLLQVPLMPTRPISAAGHLWAPYFTNRFPSRLVMLRHDEESAQWVQVATIDPPHDSYAALHGYAVVGNTILLSLQPRHFFLAFDCSTFAWDVVVTNKAKRTEYIPIPERGLYVEEDDTIYFLFAGIVYAYKLCRDQDDQHRYRMAPPAVVDCVCPFRKEGHGFLTYLGGRVMCYVWISGPLHRTELRCDCDTLHVLITTFRVKGDIGSNREQFVPKGVRVLHSTCRRLEISPSKPSECVLCFLQEYEEFNHNEDAMPSTKKRRENAMAPLTLLDWMEARSNYLESSKMLTCCRKFLNKPPLRNAVLLECSAIQIKKALYIICQDPYLSTVYEVSITDGMLACQNKTLTPFCVMDTFVCHDPEDLFELPCIWNFACDSRSIHVVPCGKGQMYVCDLDAGTVDLLDTRRLIGDDFSFALVLQVGYKTIAISGPLDCVYYLSHYTQEWVLLMNFSPVDLGKKINIGGYVVLSDESFMVSDYETSCCYLFDLENATRKDVLPYPQLTTSLPLANSGCQKKGSFHGRSVFAEGFIYTCARRRLAAYEIIEGDSCCLGDVIYLQIPWPKGWERNKMCLDYVGKDMKSGAIMFCVVQGDIYCPRPGAPSKHPIWITTIHVNTERMPNGKLKPVGTGLADFSTAYIERNALPIRISNCFAVAG